MIIKAYAEMGARRATEILSRGRAGQTAAGRANGQNIAAERAALRYMTPNQLSQSATRYLRQTGQR